jgi:hypothetical protein
MKLLWPREEYVMRCSRKDRSGTAWFRAGTRKLRGTRKGLGVPYVTGRKALWIFYQNAQKQEG